MCGIFGYFKHDNTTHISVKYRENLLSHFIKTQHRGPEQTVFKNVTDNIFLGFHRLCIVDVKHGIQPFYNKEETIFCICNGEIYNHKELRVKHNLHTQTENDCEVVLSLYHKYVNIKECYEQKQKTWSGLDNIDKLIAELDGVYSFVLLIFVEKYL